MWALGVISFCLLLAVGLGVSLWVDYRHRDEE
jgi:hypothetical protein